MTRKAATCFALAALAFTASGLALALHNHDCASQGEHHNHQDCAQHYTFQAGFGAQLATPVVSPTLHPWPYAKPSPSAERRVSNFQAETIIPRGPPLPPFDVA